MTPVENAGARAVARTACDAGGGGGLCNRIAVECDAGGGAGTNVGRSRYERTDARAGAGRHDKVRQPRAPAGSKII